MDKYFNKKELIKGIIIIILYFVLPRLLVLPFKFIHISGNPMSIYNFQLYYIYGSTALLFIIIYFKALKKDLKDFKKNYKKYLSIAFSYWIKGLFVMVVSSNIINLFNIPANANQESNIAILKMLPLTQFILACIMAPITEELVFRGGLNKGIKNDKIYIAVTSLLFAYIHVKTSLSNPISILYLIPYGALSVSFAYTLRKTNNIFSTIIIHGIHNFIALILILGGI